MADDNKIEAERQELNLLINKGITFDIERTIYVRKKGIKGYFKKRYAKAESLKFSIQEPTLSTLDRMSAEQLDLKIDENVSYNNNYTRRRRSKKNTKKATHCFTLQFNL